MYLNHQIDNEIMFRIHNQPLDGSFGKELQKAISNDYSKLIIVSAFARLTGVLAIKNELIEFKNRGGKIFAYIGADLNGTSKEALNLLKKLTDCLNICKDSRSGIIFHPKMYVLENDKTAWVAIGSNNLTHSGLYKNIECASIMILDLSAGEDRAILKNIHDTLNAYHKSEKFCIEANEIIIEELYKNGYISKEIDDIKRNRVPSESTWDLEKIFGKLTISSNNDGHNQISLDESDVKMELTSASKFWIQTKKMTGGSSNQLDLSKTGKILRGDATGTPYMLDNEYMLGSVSFFGINPNDITVTKDITISYNGLDYVGNTIKIETEGKKPNGS